jgi:electron transfer flavoprotein beta subunit
MKIVVAVKQVAVLDEEFELADERYVDRDFLDWSLNEWDEHALEAALQLRDATDDSDVVCVTVGDEEAEEGLLACLAKGADRAVRIWRDELGEADVMRVAATLAAFVERDSPDLVLCGAQSSDAVNGATGVALAGLLDLTHVAVIRSLELDGDRLTVGRELEGGLVERLELDLPALLTIQTGMYEPRYATLRAIKQARDKPLAVLTDAAASSVPVAARTNRSRLRRLTVHAESATAEMLDGAPSDVAARIAQIIKEALQS